MIFASIMSGLGNQLYQYANARAISLNLNTDLYLDLRWFEDKSIFRDENAADRMYLLDKFNINATEYRIHNSNSIKIKSNFKFKKANLYNRFLAKTIKNGIYFFKYNGDITKYDADFENIIDNSYIACASQSYKNFYKYIDTIRTELSLKSFEGGTVQNQAILEKLQKDNNSVCLHFRRGDKANNHSVKNIHGCLDIEYYNNALRILENNVGKDLNLYVFSDEIEWVKNNFSTKYNTNYIDFNLSEEDSIYDFELMKNCNYHICANSTFSVFSSILSSTSKISIAPNFVVKKMNFVLNDIYPKNFIICS